MTATKGASLMCYLWKVEDPGKPSNGTRHDFLEILVIAIAPAFSDCDTIEDIAYWGRRKEKWLREFLVLKNGVPSEETFLRVFPALDPQQFEVAFRRWVAGVVGAFRGGVAVDGKTVRDSGCGGETAIHMDSGFATEVEARLSATNKFGEVVESESLPIGAFDLRSSHHRWLASLSPRARRSSFSRSPAARGERE